MRKNKLNNNGFSLVEMIIVILLVSVVVGFMFMGVSVLNSRPVDECAKKLQIALQSNRNTTMGKLESNIKVFKEDDYIKVEETINDNSGNNKTKKTMIGERSVKVKYKVTGVAEPIELTEVGITLVFDRSSGSLKKISGGLYDGKYVEKFIISRGSKEMEVKIDHITGRISVE